MRIPQCLQSLRLLSVCSIILAHVFHIQGYLMTQDGSWSPAITSQLEVKGKKTARGKKGLSQLVQLSLSSLPRGPKYFSLIFIDQNIPTAGFEGDQGKQSYSIWMWPSFGQATSSLVIRGFLGGSDDKGSACNAGNLSLISGLKDLLENGAISQPQIQSHHLCLLFPGGFLALSTPHVEQS